MVRPLVSFPASRLLSAGIVMTLVAAVISCSSSTKPSSASAEESKDATSAKAAESDPDYAIPDGTPQEILDAVKKLQQRRPKFANRQELIDHAIKVQRALIAAGDKILKQDAEPDMLEKGVDMKLDALMMLAANQIEETPKEALEAIRTLRVSDNKILSEAANQRWLTVRILNAGDMQEAERTALAEEVLTGADKKQFDRTVLGDVMQFGRALEDAGQTDAVVAYYTRAAEMMEHHGTPQLAKMAERMKGTARRAALPGNEMQIEATMLDGKPFDWASYRGKVVLVDFWATWCGPCIAELPNVKENYKKYHDKGFDVVGISLDRAREPLEKFIEKEELPWAQLYDEEIQKGQGWNHPVAQHYGISAIPTVILVGKDGKVVSMKARGPELGKQLEKLLGKAE